MSRPSPPLRDLILTGLPPMLLGAAGAGACYLAAGPTLGVFFGGMLFAVILAPPLVGGHDRWSDELSAAGGVVDGVGLVWLYVAVRSDDVTFIQWALAYALLAAVAFALWGIIAFARRWTNSGIVAAAIAVVLGLLWMTWPVWLSPWVTGTPRGEQAVGLLTQLHPPLALNGLLSHLGVWGEQRIAYQVTALGQDVPYQLPGGVLPSLVFHCMTGLGLLLLAHTVGRRDVSLAVDVHDREEG